MLTICRHIHTVSDLIRSQRGGRGGAGAGPGRGVPCCSPTLDPSLYSGRKPNVNLPDWLNFGQTAAGVVSRKWEMGKDPEFPVLNRNIECI